MKRFITFLFCLSILIAGCQPKLNPEILATKLSCEYQEKALITTGSPRLGWEMQSTEFGQKQTAWQVLVSDREEDLDAGIGSIWNSKKQKGSQSFGLHYQGKELQSFTKYFWKVRIWDKDGKVSPWSNTSTFITGAFSEDDWTAEWIGDQPEKALDYQLLYKHIGYLSSYTEKKDDEKWLIIDLGKSQSFDAVKLYPSYNNKRDVTDYYFPLNYTIEVSEDGNSWNTLTQVKKDQKPGGKAVQHDVQATGRYIRCLATKLREYDHINFNPLDRYNNSNTYAFSLAEFEVLNKGKVISTGCSVKVKDALIKIDREDGYDPDMLTDGITTTPEYPEHRKTPPSPLLRKSFELKSKPVQALAFVSALGLYDLTFNGIEPDQRVLAPEWTDYNKRVQYQVYDVTEMLSAGENVIASQLADGWYAGMLGPVRWSPYYPHRGVYGLDRRLFVQLQVEFEDGKTETITSNGSWKIHTDGPVRMADNFRGETYDAGKVVDNWRNQGFGDDDWKSVYSEKLNKNLVPQINQPIRIIETFPAQSVEKSKKGHHIFDVGQNIAGWCSIKLKGEAGDVIVMQHGEILDEEGELYTENLKKAVQIDSVILGETGELTYEPRFTYHGFRFVEVKGLKGDVDKSMLEAKVVASEQPRTGYFECSNPMLNQLYKNINRSHVSNMHSVPTDCPQRDERCGWMGDAYIFAQASIFNRDMAAFYNKWMQDVIDAQAESGSFPDIAPHPFAPDKHFTSVPGWADAGIQVPLTMYYNYGDLEIIKRYYDAYEKYIAYIVSHNPDGIWKYRLGNNYGDWLNGNTLRAEGFPRRGAQIPSDVFGTIMFYNSVRNLSLMSGYIGKKEEEKKYADLASHIKTAFLETFVDENGMIAGDAQSCYALALFYGLYDADTEKNFEKRMIDKFIPYDGRMNTGFHSTLPLMKEMAKRGYWEKAYQLLETTDFPSWGYSIEQGATSIWERWDGYVKGRGVQGAGMNSFNHYAFGAVGEWMYNHILGIQPIDDYPGFTRFVLKPQPGGSLTWAKGSYHSISGDIKTAWEKNQNKFSYNIQIPPNTEATVSLPANSAESVLVNDKALVGNFDYTIDGKNVVFDLPAGKYKLLSEL